METMQAAPAAAAAAPLPVQAMQSSSRRRGQEQQQGRQHWRRLETARLTAVRCALCAWTARLASRCRHAGTAPAWPAAAAWRRTAWSAAARGCLPMAPCARCVAPPLRLSSAPSRHPCFFLQSFFVVPACGSVPAFPVVVPSLRACPALHFRLSVCQHAPCCTMLLFYCHDMPSHVLALPSAL